MPQKRRRQAARQSSPTARSKSRPGFILSRGARRDNIALASLAERSAAARDRGLHVLAAMRGNPKLSLTEAARLQGIKPATVKKYFSSALEQVRGRFRAKKSDRYGATLYVPDAHGNRFAVRTRSSKDRTDLGRYLGDLGRYLGGKRDALAGWHGKKIAGVELLTSGRTITAIEPALSDFPLYRIFNGGAA